MKRVTNGGAHLRGLALDKTAPSVMSLWRHYIRFDQPGIEPLTYRTESDVFNDYTN